jgi:hypothetical protein
MASHSLAEQSAFRMMNCLSVEKPGFEAPHPAFTVSKLSLGGIHDFVRTEHIKFGVGALTSRYGIPDALKSVYGDPTSYMVFARLKIR